VAAQGTGGGTPTPGAYVITISNMSFSPLDLHVPPGATVEVVNKDGIDHSVTSEATPGSYTPGAPSGLAPFDTGVFATGQKTFTLPSSATAGTAIPYYCSVHRQTMATPNGMITVDPGAQATSSTTPSTPPPSITSMPTSMPTPAPAPAPISGPGY
jgi:plastocyanin